MSDIKELNEEELEEVTGGRVTTANGLYKKCCVCKKQIRTAILYEGKNYCAECYANKIKELNVKTKSI